MFSRRSAPVRAVEDVSFSLGPRTTIAITGPSGSGKSTLARCVACLEKFDSGDLFVAGQNVSALPRDRLRAVRRQIQLIPQASALSLNPRLTALEAVREPLDIDHVRDRRERNRLALAAMRRVGLEAEAAERKSDEFSAGQRQRLALARALLCQPRILILDETLTGLDVCVRASILNLLFEVQREFDISYVLISHDTDVIEYMADRRLVMNAGRVVQCISASGEATCDSRHS